MRVPLGVIGIIYESRPNVTIDAAALCLKSGNAVILRGGSEAIDSNTYLAGLIQEGLAAAQLPAEAVQVVQTTDRAAVGKMITMTEYIDVIVPRGGKSLIARLMADGRVPMIKHLDGISDADIAGLNIPTGIPLYYELGSDLKPVKSGGEYLDPDAAKAAIEAVANQGKR